MIGKNSNEKVRQQAAFATLLATAIFLLYILNDFIIPFLGAVIFHQVLKGLMWRLVDKLKWNKNLAAFAIILVSFIIFTIPILYLIDLLYYRLLFILSDSNSLINNVHVLNDKLKLVIGIDVITEENIESLKNKATEFLPSIINKIFVIAGQIVIMYFILFYFLINHKAIPVYIRNLLPFESETIDMFFDELNSMTMSNVIGSPILALVQGISAILAFYFFNANEPVFWGAMCGIFSFIPFIGSAIIWIPVGVFTYLNGYEWQGFAILIYGFLVISNIDNIMRMYIQKYFADVHPVITVLGVFAGLKLFGIIGLIIGPLLISYFVLGLRIYRKSYSTF